MNPIESDGSRPARRRVAKRMSGGKGSRAQPAAGSGWPGRGGRRVLRAEGGEGRGGGEQVAAAAPPRVPPRQLRSILHYTGPGLTLLLHRRYKNP
ncbi:unnamed protein product [Danaus chrysippus]|uniref:(African queen) hypothetical protein n=1 Tax=Danaus chrysippus TaxID=151541 RepID=A0A8J2QJ55_9NEOP|nr:unnamed protein product [Danaus chrysippus]